MLDELQQIHQSLNANLQTDSEYKHHDIPLLVDEVIQEKHMESAPSAGASSRTDSPAAAPSYIEAIDQKKIDNTKPILVPTLS